MGMRSRQLASGAGWQVEDVICNSGPRDRPFDEQHSSVCIALVTAGSFQYRTAHGAALMAPGSLLLGNVGACFTCGHEHRAGDRCLSFRFTPEYFERIVASVPKARVEFKLPRLPPIAPLLPVLSDAQVLRDAAGLGQSDPAAPLAPADSSAAEEVALRLAGDVCSALVHGSGAPPACSERDERRVTQALRRIEVDLAESVPLEELAREAAMSPYHFLRVFERVVGVTPGQYRLRTRLRRAAVLLRCSSLRIASVAAECGFGDLSTFNRQFRRAMRATPHQYRTRATPVP
jgi:AraC family transcriptional regulator